MIVQWIGSWVTTFKHKDDIACTTVRYIWERVEIFQDSFLFSEWDDFMKADWWPKMQQKKKYVHKAKWIDMRSLTIVIWSGVLTAFIC